MLAVRGRYPAYYTVLVVIMIGFVEACSAMAYWSHLVLPEIIYRSDFFLCIQCKKDNYDPHLGWNSYPSGKRGAPRFARTCGAAFGDSFTHGDEVDEAESWPFIVSTYNECNFDNFGVGGYGLDQSYLKYLRYRPRGGQIIIISVYQEMLKRDFAASFRFYASRPDSLPKPFFRLRRSGLSLEAAPTLLDQESIRAHHQWDRYARPYWVEFPYFLSLVRIMYYRLCSTAFSTNRLEGRSAWTDPESLRLSLAITSSFIKAATEDGNKPVVLMVPKPDDVAENKRPYDIFMSQVRNTSPTTCVVDPFELLRERYNREGNLKAPKGHFKSNGNEAIAAALVKGMGQCNLAIAALP